MEELYFKQKKKKALEILHSTNLQYKITEKVPKGLSQNCCADQ